MYTVTYYDKGNCEIAWYSLAADCYLDAIREANDFYFYEGYPVSEVFAIKVELIP